METEDFVVEGFAKSIIPLVKHGKFITCNSDNELVITEIYENNQPVKWTIPTYEIVDEIFIVAEKMPEFTGGELQLKIFLAKHFVYPKILSKTNGISGTVYVNFIVDKNGWVKKPTIIKGFDNEIDNECLRTVAKLPKYQPGKSSIGYVNVKITTSLQIGE